MAYPSDLARTKNWITETLYDTDLEGQLDLIINWVMAVMNATTGHKHDATANEGPKINMATGLTVASQAQGDIITATSSSAWGRVAKGTAGQALVMNAGATAPEFAGYAVPSGVIVMWSGAVSAIPSGWVICDGDNSTPDLTGRFIVHADADSGGTYDVGNTGGAATHAHTIALDSAFDSGPNTTKYFANADTNTTDNTSTVSNLPPYYALAYIMKT